MVKKAVWIALFSLAAVSGLQGQSLGDYMKLRRQLKISSPTGGSALLSLVGLKSFEIRGCVQGVSQANGLSYVLLKSDDDQLLNIRTRNLPDWISANEIVVRLLVKSSRETDTSELSTFLIAAAPDAQIAPLVDKEKTSNTPAPARSTSNLTSRSGSPLRGSIGPNGTKLDSSGRSWSVPQSEATPIYATFIKNRNPRLSDAEAYRIAQGVIGFSLQYGVDARLIMAILIIESGFNPNSTSHSGAMGLGQLMPDTAAGLGITRPYDSMENLYGTVRTVRGHLERYNKQTGGDSFQSLVLTLAAYNAGSGAVKRAGGVPPYAETQRYVNKVISVYMQLTGQK